MKPFLFCTLKLFLFSALLCAKENDSTGTNKVNPDSVSIIRDKWGVPHIYGVTDADVAYGLAWANAEDDFHTIQETYLAVKGMEGIKNGKKGMIIDYVVQLIKARDIVEEKYETDISPEFKKYLNAYAQGINAYAETHPKEILAKNLFPINPQDILCAYVLSFSLMCKLNDVLGRINTGKIEPYFRIMGSNGIAMNSNKTVNGEVFLGINPHMPLEGPLSWYEAHLVSKEGLNILGGLFPGGVSVFCGTNGNIGWGHTSNFVDFIDIYQLKMNPKEKYQYELDGKWEELEVRKVKLKTKLWGILPITIKKKAFWSKYGATLKTPRGKKTEFYSIRFAANMEIRGSEEWYRMNKAQNFTQFKNALEMQALPCMNVVYADRYDTIFYLGNGLVPIREEGYNWKKTLPGNTSQTLWTQFHPFADLPQVLNPSCGYIFNVNNSPFEATCDKENYSMNDYDKNMGYELITNNRSCRMEQILQNKDAFTFEDFKMLKYDLYLPDTILAIFNLSLDKIFKMDPIVYPKIADALDIIKKWDHSSDMENVEASIVLLSGYYLKKISDKKKSPNNIEQAEVWSGTDGAVKQIPDEWYVKAVKKARRHLLRFYNSLSVPLGDLQRLSRGDDDMPLAGFPDVLSAMYSKPYKHGRFKAFAGESYIQLLRFANDSVEIETVNAFGNSDNPRSSHYNDQMELFTNQKTKTMSLNKDVILKEAERIYHPK
jgi:acyl-homoserine-lactone acylase